MYNLQCTMHNVLLIWKGFEWMRLWEEFVQKPQIGILISDLASVEYDPLWWCWGFKRRKKCEQHFSRSHEWKTGRKWALGVCAGGNVYKALNAKYLDTKRTLPRHLSSWLRGGGADYAKMGLLWDVACCQVLYAYLTWVHCVHWRLCALWALCTVGISIGSCRVGELDALSMYHFCIQQKLSSEKIFEYNKNDLLRKENHFPSQTKIKS